LKNDFAVIDFFERVGVKQWHGFRIETYLFKCVS
jgi:hypothetical protein